MGVERGQRGVRGVVLAEYVDAQSFHQREQSGRRRSETDTDLLVLLLAALALVVLALTT